MVGRARCGVGQQRPGGQVAGLILLIGTEAAARDEELFLVGCEVRPQQGQVAGDLRHRAQERVRFGGGERGRDPGGVRASAHPGRFSRTHGQEAYGGAPGTSGTGRRPRRARQRPMCLTSWAIWLLTSTVRGSLSIATASVAGVQRSSVSTESAIDHPA